MRLEEKSGKVLLTLLAQVVVTVKKKTIPLLTLTRSNRQQLQLQLSLTSIYLNVTFVFDLELPMKPNIENTLHLQDTLDLISLTAALSVLLVADMRTKLAQDKEI